jgi:hypothetical protein
MQKKTDDIWFYWTKGYWVVVPTNGHINKQGEATMGRGVAYQANKLFKGLSKALGKLMVQNGNTVFLFEKQRLITFPTKNYWKDPSDLGIIEHSCKTLKALLKQYKKEKIKFVMPKVGCGNGKLSWDKVQPIIKAYFSDLEEDQIMIVDNEQGDSDWWIGRNRDEDKEEEKKKKALIKEIDQTGNTVRELHTEEEVEKDQWEQRKKLL